MSHSASQCPGRSWSLIVLIALAMVAVLPAVALAGESAEEVIVEAQVAEEGAEGSEVVVATAEGDVVEESAPPAEESEPVVVPGPAETVDPALATEESVEPVLGGESVATEDVVAPAVRIDPAVLPVAEEPVSVEPTAAPDEVTVPVLGGAVVVPPDSTPVSAPLVPARRADPASSGAELAPASERPDAVPVKATPPAVERVPEGLMQHDEPWAVPARPPVPAVDAVVPPPSAGSGPDGLLPNPIAAISPEVLLPASGGLLQIIVAHVAPEAAESGAVMSSVLQLLFILVAWLLFAPRPTREPIAALRTDARRGFHAVVLRPG